MFATTAGKSGTNDFSCGATHGSMQSVKLVRRARGCGAAFRRPLFYSMFSSLFSRQNDVEDNDGPMSFVIEDINYPPLVEKAELDLMRATELNYKLNDGE